jgi:hypothetical protein
MLKRIILFGVLIIVVLALSVTSCNKSDSNIKEKKEEINTKKITEWLNSRILQASDSGKVAIGQLVAEVNLLSATREKFKDGKFLIVIDIANSYKTANNFNKATRKSLVLIENSNKKIEFGNVVEVLREDLSDQPFPDLFYSKIFMGQRHKFSGLISILSITNKFVYELGYSDGNISSQKFFSPKKLSKNQIKNTGGRINQCIDWYWQYFVNGILTYEEYAYTTCGPGDICEQTRLIDGRMLKINCGGGGGSSGSVSIINVDSVINLLDSTCFIQFVNAIGDDKLKSELVKLYQNTFTGIGSTHNIKFKQEYNLLFNGQPIPAKSYQDPTSPNTWVVVLNSNYSNSGTYESWGQTILHELIHGFIRKNNLNFTQATPNFTQEHKDMLSSWVYQMKDALMELYSMPPADALALCFDGIDDVLKNEVSGTFRQSMINWVQNTYNVNLIQASALSDKYYTGEKGTKCP